MITTEIIGRRTQEVLKGMREYADYQEKCHCIYDCRNLATDSVRNWADRIEDAIKADQDESFDAAMAVLEKSDAVQAMSPIVDALAERKAKGGTK